MVATKLTYFAVLATFAFAFGCGGDSTPVVDSGVDSAVDSALVDSAVPDAEIDSSVDSGVPDADADAGPMGPPSDVLFNTAGQGEMSGGGFQMSLSVGAPAPYGSTSGAGQQLETGANAYRR